VGAAQVEVVQAAIEYAEQAVKATIGASIAEQLNEFEIHALKIAAAVRPIRRLMAVRIERRLAGTMQRSSRTLPCAANTSLCSRL
jgi:hypothetical protein